MFNNKYFYCSLSAAFPILGAGIPLFEFMDGFNEELRA